MNTFNIDIKTINFCWSDTGKLIKAYFNGEECSLYQPNRFFLNGHVNEGAHVEKTGDNSLKMSSDFSGSELRLYWYGDKKLRVRVEAASIISEITEAGFSIPLPRGDVITLAEKEALLWERLTVSERISFDSIMMAIGQFFLLKAPDFCLRIGRQVERKVDYTTGYMEKTPQGWNLVWKWQAQVPLSKDYTAQCLEFAVFNTVEEAVEEHRIWMEKQFKLVPKENNPKTPEWFKKTKLVIQMNLGETNGAVLHDYRDVTNLMEDADRMGIPEHTIFYIPDYNFLSLPLKGCHGPVCACWPENPLLGGKREFIRMVETAVKHGFHIMPHASIVLLLEKCRLFADENGSRVWTNPEWERMRQWSVLGHDGNPIGWPPAQSECPDVDSWAYRYPYTIRYLNQAFEEVRSFFIEGIDRMIGQYRLDAVYFDSLTNNCCNLSVWNSLSQGETRARGEAEIIRQLYVHHPAVLFAGEGCTEESVSLVPLWNWRTPMCHKLFGRYVYTFAHTSTPCALPQRYLDVGGISVYNESALQEEICLSGKQSNNIPTLSVNFRDRQYDELTQKYIRILTCI